MRESLTLFVAVLLSLLLCLPMKSLTSVWGNSLDLSSVYSSSAFNFPSILSIQFKVDNEKATSKESCQLHLIPSLQNQEFKIDWQSFTSTDVFIQLYNSSGKLINIFQKTNNYVQEDQLDDSVDSVKLVPGIYYAQATWLRKQSTQSGYAKFVVK